MDQKTDRRNFIVGTISVTGAFIAGSACKTLESASQTKYYQENSGKKLAVRKSILKLSRQSPDIVAFEKAIARMRELEGEPVAFVVNTPGRNGNPRTLVIPMPQSNPSAPGVWGSIPKDGRSWFRQAQIHWDKCQHGTMHFLSWHRIYLHCFEELIRLYSGEPGFALPYWNWETDARLPELCVAEFSSPGVRNQLWIRGRSSERPTIPESSIGLERINRSVSLPTFEQFSRDLEGSPHGSVHVYTGGEMGAFMSPLDPIFWMHHCNIDRIWEIWRNRVGSDNDRPKEFDQWRQTTLDGFWDTKGNQFASQADTTLNPGKNFGYQYEDLELPPPPPPPPVPESLTQAAEAASSTESAPGSSGGSATTTSNDSSTGKLSLNDEVLDFEHVELEQTKITNRNEIAFDLPIVDEPELVEALDRASFDETLGASLTDSQSFSTVTLELRSVAKPTQKNVILKAFLNGPAGEVHVSDFYFFDNDSVKSFNFYCEAAYPLRKAVANSNATSARRIKLVLRLVSLKGEQFPTPTGIRVRLKYVRK